VPAMTSSAERAERERAFFDNICISTTPNISSREWWESPGGRSRFERRISFILNELKSYGPHPRLLLIGCGNGQWFERLSPHAELRAIDISPKMVESLQSRLSDDDKRRVEVGNAHSMEFEDSSFDMVIANSTLHHLELSEALQDVSRVLQDNGSLLAFEPNRCNPQVWMMHQTSRARARYGLSDDEEAFGRRLITSQLCEYFSQVNVRHFDFWHPVFGSHIGRPFLYRTLLLLERVPVINQLSGSLSIIARNPKRGAN